MIRRRLSSLAQSRSAKSWKASSSATGNRSPGYSLHRFFSAPSNQNDDYTDTARVFTDLSQDSNDSDSFPFSVDQGFSDSVPIPVSPDIVTVTAALPDSIEVATAVTSVLGHSPPHLVIRLLENVHLLAEIPYWETIVVTTVALRLILFPIAVYTVKSASRMAHAKPKIQKLQTEFQNHPNNMDPALQTEFRRKMSQLLEREKVNPVRSLIFPIVQIPMFISFFFGLKEIGQFLPGAVTGGTLWFTDLTTTDPYFIFPVLNALTFLVIIEIGVDGLPSNPDLDRFKWVG
jgi:YidC/Oxa1 family membrane protein insertase